jgi:hypothetical protein
MRNVRAEGKRARSVAWSALPLDSGDHRRRLPLEILEQGLRDLKRELLGAKRVSNPLHREGISLPRGGSSACRLDDRALPVVVDVAIRRVSSMTFRCSPANLLHADPGYRAPPPAPQV